MKVETKLRKKARAGFRQISTAQQRRQQMHEILQNGIEALNAMSLELGRQMAEFILYAEREELAGPDYQPAKEGLYQWASEPGSVRIGGQKVTLERPRLRLAGREVALKSYAATAFGLSPSAVSERLVEATGQKLKDLRERRLDDILLFTVFMDTVHRGGTAFVVALGLDTSGQKRALGFWEGVTEHAEVAHMLLAELEERGLKLSAKVLFIIDGGQGLAKALRDRYGRKLVLPRCTLHKDRNLQLP